MTGSGGVYLVARYGLGVLVSIGNMLVLTWWIGPHAYGVFVVAVGLVAFLSSIARAGVDTYLVRRQPMPEKQTYSVANTLVFTISVALLLFGLALAPVLVRWYGDREFVAPYLVLLLTIPVVGLIGVPTAKLERELNFRSVASIELSGQSAGLLVSLVLAWLHAGVWAPVAGQTTWQVVNLMAVCRSAHLLPAWNWDRCEMRRMLSYGIGLTAALRVWQLRTLVNPLLVGRFAGTDAVAFVGIAIRIAESLGSLRLAAGRIAIAALARVTENREQFRNMLQNAITLQVITLGPLLCAFALTTKLAIRVIGVRWTPSLAVFPFVATGVLVNSVYNLQASALFVLGRQWTVMRAYAVHVILLGTATVFLNPHLGIAGYGWAELLACVAYISIHRTMGTLAPLRYRFCLSWLALFTALLFLPAVSYHAAWLLAGTAALAGLTWRMRHRGPEPVSTRARISATSPAVCSLKAHILVAACIAMTPAVRVQARLSELGSVAQRNGKTIPATLFGLHFRRDKITWPGVPFGALRLWDTDTRWQNMNPARGTYDFKSLDDYLAVAKHHGIHDILLTLGGTPAWASSRPEYPNCDFSSVAPGDCAPPYDLNPKGSGSDQYWRDFLFHLGSHLAQLDPSQYVTVSTFSVWNEFTRGAEFRRASWLGTNQQLRRMVADARCILTGRGTSDAFRCTPNDMHVPAVATLPKSRIVSPEAVPTGLSLDRLSAYFAGDRAPPSFDVIAVHAYTYENGTTPDRGPSGLPAQWASLSRIVPSDWPELPVWSTEGSWGDTKLSLPDPDMEMGYIARYYLVGWSLGFERMYWYAADNSWGELIKPNGAGGCRDHGDHSGCPTRAAVAWTQTYRWMVGNVMTSPCATDNSGQIWTCALVKPSGTKLLAVWDASQACSSGICGSTLYPYSPLYKQYFTLDSANPVPLTGGTVKIGWKPILLSE